MLYKYKLASRKHPFYVSQSSDAPKFEDPFNFHGTKSSYHAFHVALYTLVVYKSHCPRFLMPCLDTRNSPLRLLLVILLIPLLEARLFQSFIV